MGKQIRNKKRKANASVKAEPTIGVGVGVGIDSDGKIFGGPAVLGSTTSSEGAPYNPGTGTFQATVHGTDGGGLGVTFTGTDFNGKTGETTGKEGTFTLGGPNNNGATTAPPPPSAPDGDPTLAPPPPASSVDSIDGADFQLHGTTPLGRAAEAEARSERGNGNDDNNNNGNTTGDGASTDAPGGGPASEDRASDTTGTTRAPSGAAIASPSSRPLDPRFRMDPPDAPGGGLPGVAGLAGGLLGGPPPPGDPGDPAAPGDPGASRGPVRPRR